MASSRILLTVAAITVLCAATSAQHRKICWADEMPVGWGMLDGRLRALGVDSHPVVYPILKPRGEAE